MRVCVGDSVVGFIESAGVVFVALHGSRYDRAVEVAQSLAFDVAVASLLSHVRVVDHLNAELAKPVPSEARPAPSKPAATARVA